MLESRSYGGDVDVEGVEWGVQITEDSSVGVRTWLQLMCCNLTRLSLISEGTSRGDKRGLYCWGIDWNK